MRLEHSCQDELKWAWNWFSLDPSDYWLVFRNFLWSSEDWGFSLLILNLSQSRRSSGGIGKVRTGLPLGSERQGAECADGMQPWSMSGTDYKVWFIPLGSRTRVRFGAALTTEKIASEPRKPLLSGDAQERICVHIEGTPPVAHPTRSRGIVSDSGCHSPWDICLLCLNT